MPLFTPARDSGKTTFANVWNAFAPRSRLALISDGFSSSRKNRHDHEWKLDIHRNDHKTDVSKQDLMRRKSEESHEPVDSAVQTEDSDKCIGFEQHIDPRRQNNQQQP